MGKGKVWFLFVWAFIVYQQQVIMICNIIFLWYRIISQNIEMDLHIHPVNKNLLH